MQAAVGAFFDNTKVMVSLLDIKPKLNAQDEKRIRLDLSMVLTAEALSAAPENVKEAFYAVTKDSLGLNPVGLMAEFQDVKATFFATPQTKTPSLEIAGCTLRQLEVSRPEKKATLDDGDVRLGFNITIPASREVWNWSYLNFGADLALLFEELQPMLPHIKEANPNGDGQGILNMEKQQVEPTVVKPEPAMSARARAEKVLGGKDDMPHQGKEQKKAVSKIAGKKKK